MRTIPIFRLKQEKEAERKKRANEPQERFHGGRTKGVTEVSAGPFKGVELSSRFFSRICRGAYRTDEKPQPRFFSDAESPPIFVSDGIYSSDRFSLSFFYSDKAFKKDFFSASGAFFAILRFLGEKTFFRNGGYFRGVSDYFYIPLQKAAGFVII